MRPDDKTLIDRLRSLSRVGDPEVVREELSGMRPEDIAEVLPRLEVEEGLALLQRMEPEVAAFILDELPTETAKAYLQELPDEAVANYLDILPMDDALELREELTPERFEALLHVIPQEDAQEIRRLLSFPEGSVGQIMTEDFFWVPPEETMEGVLRRVRETPEEEYETVNYVYVLGSDQHLLGVLSLRRAVRAEPQRTAREVMHPEVVTINGDAPQEEASRVIARYGLSAMPVLDDRGRMLGIVTADDAQEVIEEADTEDVLKLGAVGGDAEPYLSLGVWQLVRRRLPWLGILFLAETFTGAVMRHYSTELKLGDGGQALPPLTFFIPLLIGAGGNSGSQVTTTITRALAVGEVRTSDYLTVLRREFTTALLMGSALGIAGFARAFLGWDAGVSLSLVVGLALPAIILWATSIDSLLPLGAKRLGIDPAVMSAPFITTFVDATGLIIYFEIARRLL